MEKRADAKVLGIHSNAVLPSNPLSVNVTGSRMLAGVELPQSLEVDATTRIMTLTLERDPADGSASGYGFVPSFLVAAQNGVSASPMVTSVDGVVIVVAVDLRMAGPHHSALGTGNDLPDADDRTSRGATAMRKLSVRRELNKGNGGFGNADGKWGCHAVPQSLHWRVAVRLPGDGDGGTAIGGHGWCVHSLSLPVTGGIGTVDIAMLPRGCTGRK
ncbi:MAG: hypothetical protein U0176_24420 [Bacteroidia bacterium]